MEATDPKPNRVVVTVECADVTGQPDVEMWTDKYLVPEHIVTHYTGTAGQKSWDVEVLVHGRVRRVNGSLGKMGSTRTWNRNHDGDSIVYADEWVRDWVAKNEPPVSLIP